MTPRCDPALSACDFCRQFETRADIDALHDAFDDARRFVWARQPQEFFERAIVDMDTTVGFPGMDIESMSGAVASGIRTRVLLQVFGDGGELFEGSFEVGGDVGGDDFGGGEVGGFFEGVVLQPEDVQVQLVAFC